MQLIATLEGVGDESCLALLVNRPYKPGQLVLIFNAFAVSDVARSFYYLFNLPVYLLLMGQKNISTSKAHGSKSRTRFQARILLLGEHSSR